MLSNWRRLLNCGPFGFQVSQTIPRGGQRTQVAIPAQGMIEFRDALTDLLEDFGTDDGGFVILQKSQQSVFSFRCVLSYLLMFQFQRRIT